MGNQQKASGFTLIELMLVVVIVAIFAAIAVPSYNIYVRKAEVSQTQQEMMRLATLLDRHKAKSFSYKGFSTVSSVVPTNATGAQIKYNLMIVDGDDPDLQLTDDDAAGQSWAIKAEPTSNTNYTLLLTSQGVRCKNKTKNNVDYVNCGTAGNEEW